MRITRATDLGLRALMVLEREVGQRTTLADLAERLNVPPRHLGKVVQRLAKHGWIGTTRGRGGGIAITPAGSRAAASQVLAALESSLPVIDCEDPPCPLLKEGCRLRAALLAAQEAFVATLAQQSVADLAGSRGAAS